MGICKLCGLKSGQVSGSLGVCLNCIRSLPSQSLAVAMEAHRKSRSAYRLPPFAPTSEKGIQCKLCVNECQIPEGEYGYCGLRKNDKGKLSTPKYEQGKLSWYLDPLPTNCVADWVCPAQTGAGYPQFSYSKEGPEYGYYNLAVFFHSCSFNCLYCQNWHFRRETFKPEVQTVEDMLKGISPSVSCICYFGGDPSTQIIFALNASKKALKNKKGKILRICWETNGSVNRVYLEKMIELSLISGGCIKFDIKAWDENLHKALTGATNRRTLQNFELVASFISQRPVPYLLIASTLLVPGYIDEKEVKAIAGFIASLNPEIPYRLLAFYPHFYMDDLPLTSKELAKSCYNAAVEAGLKNVSLGNIHLLR